MIVEIFFWFLVFIVFYSYIGYGFVVFVFGKIKQNYKKNNYSELIELPEVTLFIPAYNEKEYIESKVKNSFELDYPANKIKFLWITDGSNDGSDELLKKYKNIEVYHHSERKGKAGAINRGMKFVTTPIVIFSDCNTMLTPNTIKEMVRLFSDPSIGCVAGEKRIIENSTDSAVNAGECIYWKYESLIKKWESELNSCIGAVGELFAIRKELFNEIDPSIILDDFIISLNIASNGFKIAYTPNAFSIETASANIREELKRKIRISAGGIQALIKLRYLLNPFKYKLLSWQYISHKVLRWTIVPLSFPILLILNFYFVMNDFSSFYSITFVLQLFFYLMITIGRIFEDIKIKPKLIFVPYYIYLMNLSVYLGFIKFLRGKQQVTWEKSVRGI